ncbi:MAG: malto-oligosyltrehalose synthase, partial [Mycobacteriales bacterium]
GLGCVVDLVPNHMSVAVPALNRWWWEVLEQGPAAAHAGYFDIDWTAGRLLLPVLGDGPEELDRLELVGSELAYHEQRFPIAPGTAGGSARDVHDRQHYELVSWRRSDALAYRRFFDITELAGIRVEDPRVFDDTHREVLRWVRAGDVAGLRIDHPDGLADPGGYLSRLAAAAPGTWVVVEKILAAGEELPATWAAAGTTGYDALRIIDGVLVDPAGEAPLTGLYADLTGAETDFEELTYRLKLRAAAVTLHAETQRLARLIPHVLDAFDALCEVMACLPVYRTYLPGYGSAHLDAAVRAASRRRSDLAPSIAEIDRAARADGSEFATRLQQTTGMVMAKGVEDTAFYRYHRLVSRNEVGGEPAVFATGVEEFHQACSTRLESWPHSMTALSTHDTKRSEDVRARLNVLAELPASWRAAVEGWAGRHPGPDPNLGYLAWQTLVGAWPLTHDRALAYLEKASREAKEHTSWTDRNADYDEALVDFVGRVYADESLLAEVAEFADRITAYGWSNSLAAKLVALTMPGVPDLYQGSELWDLSLVDPDNRRPVDYDRREDLLARLDSGESPVVDGTGLAKLHVVAQALRLRRDLPAAFDGSYAPLTAAGTAASHLLGFVRGGAAITLVTRLPATLERDGGWRDTSLTLPEGDWRDALTGETYADTVTAADLLHRLPIALLVRTSRTMAV